MVSSIKDTLFKRVQTTVKVFTDTIGSQQPISGLCPVWTYFTIQTLHHYGYSHVQLQAGTALWPIVSPEEDDGVMLPHFGYQFEWDRAKHIDIRKSLPEMHFWVADATSGDIIDLTVGMQPEQQRRTSPDLHWRPNMLPLPYFWGKPEELPDSVVYAPSLPAIALGYKVITNFCKEFGLRCLP